MRVGTTARGHARGCTRVSMYRLAYPAPTRADSAAARLRLVNGSPPAPPSASAGAALAISPIMRCATACGKGASSVLRRARTLSGRSSPGGSGGAPPARPPVEIWWANSFSLPSALLLLLLLLSAAAPPPPPESLFGLFELLQPPLGPFWAAVLAA